MVRNWSNGGRNRDRTCDLGLEGFSFLRWLRGAVLGGSQAVAGMTTGITTLLGACRFRAPSRTPERLTRQGQRCATLERTRTRFSPAAFGFPAHPKAHYFVDTCAPVGPP